MSVHIPRGDGPIRHVWNPTEYLHASKDPAAASIAMDMIEQWRIATQADFPHDPGSREAIKLEAHLRQLMASFSYARPLADDAAMGNAMLTALAGTAGMIAAQSVREGKLSRVRLKSILLSRIDAIIDHEVGHDRG